jgi:hypothetical protein
MTLILTFVILFEISLIVYLYKENKKLDKILKGLYDN